MASEKKRDEVKRASSDWRVLMVQHPRLGFYYASGFKLDR